MEKLRRIIALLTVVVIVALVLISLIGGITGSKYFFGVLFLALVIPVILWVFMWFVNLVSPNSDSEKTNNDSTSEE